MGGAAAVGGFLAMCGSVGVFCSRVAWCGKCIERACIWLPAFVCKVAAMLAVAAVGVSMCVNSVVLKAIPVPLHSDSFLRARTVQLCSLQQ